MIEDARPIFHLAFPVKDIPSTVEFYRDQLGLQIGLIEDARCIINLYGHQAVAHVSEMDTPPTVKMYPRHFGIVFDDEVKFEAFL